VSLRVVKLQVTEASCEAYAKSENTADRRFENYGVAHAPLRSVESLDADYQPLIDIRKFPNQGDPDASAVIGFSARILAKNGRLVASRVFYKAESSTKSIHFLLSLPSMTHSTASQPN
jgi:hypothetical protein